jgi:hypothetical protein
MGTTNVFTKDPAAVLDCQYDWSSWLAAGETIASHTVTATDGMTVDSSSESEGQVTVWLSGGVGGSDYAATCHIATSAGREDNRSITIQVRER